MRPGPYRAHLEDALFEAGYETNEEFGRAIGFTGSAVGRWLRCECAPSLEARRAISEVLELSPGADCDEVREADIDWLLEPCDGSLG